MINSEYLKDLNKAQKEAVNHIDGPLLIVAGAGSGKTKVLTSRIANIVEKPSKGPGFNSTNGHILRTSYEGVELSFRAFAMFIWVI